MTVRIPVLLFALMLAGCAADGAEPPAPTEPSAAAVRGREFAERECSTCHAMGLNADSPRSNAPPFADIRVRGNALSLEARMKQIAAGGHYEMPALSIEPDQVRDVAAYIETLQRR